MGLRWLFVGLRWPTLAYIGLRWLSWAYVGLRYLCHVSTCQICVVNRVVSNHNERQKKSTYEIVGAFSTMEYIRNACTITRTRVSGCVGAKKGGRRCRGPSLAFVCLALAVRWPAWLSWARVGLRWLWLAVGGLHWPSLVVVGCLGPTLAVVGCRGSGLAVVGLR